MYIEEVVLEGFKSYAQRTVIAGWDPKFNAITGLNGSGKSNILDAICFVLGIENLRQVRATNLQDLIYKRGQGGVTKASVTLVFNNGNAEASPVGYADVPRIAVCRQILQGGKMTRYLVNGHQVPQKNVDTLFQSVQLNVNNPHFLIMQGQITKVLNMRPPEILAMLEEAAGTRMFEERRQKASTTIEKKNGKITEVRALLHEVIEPKLGKLRGERSDFLEFKRAESSLGDTERFLAAADFCLAQQSLARVQEKRAGAGQRLGQLDREIGAASAALDALFQEISRLEEQKLWEAQRTCTAPTTSSGSTTRDHLERDAREASNTAARLDALLGSKKAAFEQLQRRIDALRGEAKTLSRDISESASTRQTLQASLAPLQSQHSAALADLNQGEALLRSLDTGIATSQEGCGGGSSSGYAGLVRFLADQLAASQAEAGKTEMRLDEVCLEISQDLQPEESRAEAAMAEKRREIADFEVRIAAIQTELCRSRTPPAFDDPRALQHERKHTAALLDRLEDSGRRLRAGLSAQCLDEEISRMDGIYGVVASLVRVEKAHFSNALEIAAGGRLFNVP